MYIAEYAADHFRLTCRWYPRRKENRIVVSCCLAWAVVGLAHAADPAFVPKDLPGCVLWLKADAGVMTNDCGDVTKWLDQSGQGHDNENVSGNASVLATALNNHKVVRFDGQSSLQGSYDFSESVSAHSLLLLARWPDSWDMSVFGK